MSTKLENILNLVDEYIADKKSNKKWRPSIDVVRYAGDYYSSDEYMRAIKTLLEGWLVLGKDAQEFEDRFSKLFGKKYGALTNSGSSANLLMMTAMTSKQLYDFPQGTKVIVPIAGFPATLTPILQVGFKPIFVDIELDTLNLDLDQVELAAKESGAKIITFAHVLGNPPNMDRVMNIVKKYNLILLEDCCDALGSTYDGKPLGSFGEMASCSFYPAHHITMGEGGFVATNTLPQERVIKSFRDWGRACYCEGKASICATGTCRKRFSNWLDALPNEIVDHKYVYNEIGYNLKPIELQASLGLAQLDKLEEIIQIRKRNFKLLFNIFSKYEEYFYLPKATEKSDPSWFAFPLTIKDKAPFNRHKLLQYLENNKVQTRQYFGGNLMLQPAYSEMVDVNMARDLYPIATKATIDTFFLGVSPVITEEQIKYIAEIIETFFNRL
jgi:CDP-6-deoxy-D-xylo-4-hexulose-3-dehydrase